MADRTLQEIRQAIGRKLGDLVVLTATATGDTTTLTDANNLYLPNNACKNRALYFVDGTAANVGQKRIASANSQSSTNVTWGLALPSSTASSDVAEMWNARGMGWDPLQEVNPIINDVIREASQYVWAEDTEAISGVFDIDTPYFSLPSGTRGLYTVEWQDASDDTYWHEIPMGENQNAPGWTLERGANIVWILGPWAQDADTNSIRIRRYTDNSTLSSDSDTTEIPFDYLVAEAEARLLEMKMHEHRDHPTLPARWQTAMSRSQFMRAALGTRRLQPGTVVV